MPIGYMIAFSVVSAICAMLGVGVSMSNLSRIHRADAQKAAASFAALSVTLDHIKATVGSNHEDVRNLRSDMTINMREIKQDIKEQRDMIVKTQERVQAAHRRLDELTGRRGVGASE